MISMDGAFGGGIAASSGFRAYWVFRFLLLRFLSTSCLKDQSENLPEEFEGWLLSG